MISFKRELFYFVIDSYIKSLYFRLQLLSQEALEDFGLCIFPNLSNRLVSDLSYSFPFRFISSAISARVIWAMPIP